MVWRIDAAGATPVPAFGALHSGKRPEGGPAIGATLNQPSAMAVGSDGSVYVADKGNHRVAKISPNGTISTFANLLVPSRLAVGPSGAVYVINGSEVEKITPDGLVTPFAFGINQPPGFLAPSVPANTVSLEYPDGLVVDSNENVYVEINCPQSDQQNCQPGGSTSGSWIDVVVKITPNGELMTVWDPNLPAGNGEPPFNLISTYHGLALNAAGHLLVGRDDRNMNEVNLTTFIADVVLNSSPGAALISPAGVYDGATGDILADASGNTFLTGDMIGIGALLPESAYQIQWVSRLGAWTIYNDSLTDYQGDVALPGSGPPYDVPDAMATDAYGNLFVSDMFLHRVRRMAAGACPAGIGPVLSAVMDSASAAAGNQYDLFYKTYAPGELITIFGLNLGPGIGQGAVLNASGLVAPSVAGVQVLFNGIPGPLLYVSTTQINAIIPFTLYGLPWIRVQVEYNGAVSNSFYVQCADVAPNVLPVVVNSDGTINSPSNPASAGSVVVLYGIGFGRTTPDGIDGHIASAPYPVPMAPVQMLSAGTLLYAADAPDIVEGVIQLNIQLPDSVSSYTAQLQVGTATTSIEIAVH